MLASSSASKMLTRPAILSGSQKPTAGFCSRASAWSSVMPNAVAAATGAGAGAASSAASSTTASSCMTTLHAGIVAGQKRSAGALKAVFARTRASMASETVGRESFA